MAVLAILAIGYGLFLSWFILASFVEAVKELIAYLKDQAVRAVNLLRHE